jgi:hypothetical protein
MEEYFIGRISIPRRGTHRRRRVPIGASTASHTASDCLSASRIGSREKRARALLLLVWRASLAIWNFRKMLGRRQCGTNLTVFCDSWLSIVVILSFHRAFHQYTPNVIYFSFGKAKGTYREVYVLTAARTPPRSQISDVPTHELMEHEMYVKA